MPIVSAHFRSLYRHDRKFAAERRAAAAPAARQSIDISYLHSPQQQTCPKPLQRANGTDRQTDGRTPYRFIDPALHTVRAVSIKLTD